MNDSSSVDTAKHLIEQYKDLVHTCISKSEPVIIGPVKNQTLILWNQDAQLQNLEEAYQINAYTGL